VTGCTVPQHYGHNEHRSHLHLPIRRSKPADLYQRLGRVRGLPNVRPSGNRITHDDVTTDAYTNYTYNGDNSIATTILSGTTPLHGDYNVAGVMTGDGCKSWTLDTFDRAATLREGHNAPAACPTAPDGDNVLV